MIIELLHACGYEPIAAFGHLVRMDFEGDQWTFFKPPPEDLESLFGDRHPRDAALPAAARADRRAARSAVARSSSSSTPGTCPTRRPRATAQSTSRPRSPPMRSTPTARRCGTSTAPACSSSAARTTAACSGSAEFSDDVLPPYTELVRFDAGPRLRGRRAARAPPSTLLRRHLDQAPARQPVRAVRAAARTGAAGAARAAGSSDYHAYAFATVRMAGSAFEILAVPRALAVGRPGAARPSTRCARSSTGARRCRSGSPAAASSTPAPLIDGALGRIALATRAIDGCRSSAASAATLEAAELSDGWEVACAAPGATRGRRASSTASTGCPATRARNRGRRAPRRGALGLARRARLRRRRLVVSHPL